MGLTGYLDHADHDVIWGWAFDPDQPDNRMALEILVDETPMLRFSADQYRADLAAGPHGGHCGFALRLNNLVSRFTSHSIRIRRADDGAELAGSPRQVEAVEISPDQQLAGLSTMLRQAATTPESFAQAVSLLVTQTRSLFDARAAAAGAESPHRDAFDLRWEARQPAGAMEPSREADPVRRQALVIIDASGQPGLDMPSLARVQALHRIVDHVVLAPVATETPPALPDLGPVEFFQPPIYASIEEILRRHRHVFDVIVLQGADLALRYGGLIRHLLPRARLLMSVNGLASAAMDDRAAIDMQPELGQAARTLATCEGFATFMVDAVLASSARESEMLRGHGCATRIEITAWPVVPRPRSVDVAATQGVAMLGGHWPDAMLDAAEWLIGQVMTLVWSRDPTIICWLPIPRPLAAMPTRLQKLAQDRVVFVDNPDATGVPDAARLTVAPQRIGSGLQSTVLASFAQGVPCIMHRAAADGLDLRGALQSLVCADELRMAETILALHADLDRLSWCASEGLGMIANQFNLQLCEDSLARAARLPLRLDAEQS